MVYRAVSYTHLDVYKRQGLGEDHRAAAGFEHLRDLVLGAQKGTGEVDGDGVIPARFGHLGARTTFAQCAGVVEADVEPAVALDSQSDERLGLVLRAHIARQCGRFAAGRADLRDQLVQLARAPRADDDFGPFGGEQLGGGAADARTGPGNNGNFSRQASHGDLLIGAGRTASASERVGSD